ncbi:photosynthetic complex putative assembly protein PuhB [Salinarimonas ramus]|uniref:Photosynthetic complex assembly protein n=1 Tax=Salinarimonas ramus TaxID=690164 RepID=A0A917QKH4_9HYPH|nr:photosynthetic complex putative assembly protein PuhB [Salinarimonas ramus]GGK54958.1 photosynthetic complex assembly protein [Salinarimonas ramus]
MSIAIVKKPEEALAASAREASEAEPVTPRGLPAPLPKGETMLWQGQPSWRGMARRAMHLRGLSLYFGVLAVVAAADALASGGGPLAAVLGATWLLVIGAAAIGLLSLYAWLSARSTFFTVTNERVILSFGVALPMSVNVPFKLVENVAIKRWPNGTGDVVLTVKSERRLSYVLFWPYVRPWRFSKVEPMLRCVPDVERVAAILAERLTAIHGENAAAEPATARGTGRRDGERRASGLEPATA